jgi:hypothetical protein
MIGKMKTLLAMHEEIQQMQNSVLGLFIRSKINDFYKNNGLRIDTFYKERKKLQLEYFEIEEDGERIKKEGEGKDAKPLMKEGKDRKEFDEKFEALMDKELNIKI